MQRKSSYLVCKLVKGDGDRTAPFFYNLLYTKKDTTFNSDVLCA